MLLTYKHSRNPGRYLFNDLTNTLFTDTINIDFCRALEAPIVAHRQADEYEAKLLLGAQVTNSNFVSMIQYRPLDIPLQPLLQEASCMRTTSANRYPRPRPNRWLRLLLGACVMALFVAYLDGAIWLRDNAPAYVANPIVLGPFALLFLACILARVFHRR
jgi:hypothetical protein